MAEAKRKRRSQSDHADLDVAMMRRALKRARRAVGRVEPNPMVGCVITQHGRIIGEGHHQRFGGPHAEVHALRSCKASPRGATVYVTLEPCAHFGKTPPCLDALLAAKVGRVVIGVLDPNPQVAGKSARRLRREGITVDVGLCEEEARDLAAPYLTLVNLRRPYVIAKWAQTLDGKLATHTGDSKWISGEASRKLVHKLRARVDAIVVGSRTVLADDPELTARDVPLKRLAHRVVLDGRLRTPESCKLVKLAGKTPTILFTSRDRAGTPKARRLAKRGVQVVAVAARNDRLLPKACLQALYRRDMTNVVLEGGAVMLNSFFQRELVDEAWVFTAPFLSGDDRVSGAVTGRRPKLIRDALQPRLVEVKTLGADTLHRLRFDNTSNGT